MSGSTLERSKRFYKNAAAGRASEEGGWLVLLDGRPLRTPARAQLIVPTERLATLIAAEWDSQLEHIEPSRMPLTRLANVALDRMRFAREETVAEIVKYTSTDLLLVRAEDPDALVTLQRDAWDPILKWVEQTYGVRFHLSIGVSAPKQNPAALDAVAIVARALDDLSLTAFAHLAAILGSSLLAFAVFNRRLSGPEAFNASRIDEAWQESKWGVDFEAEARTKRLLSEVESVASFLDALKE